MKSIKSVNTGGNSGAIIANAANTAANTCKEFSANRSTLLISGDVVVINFFLIRLHIKFKKIFL